MLTMIAAKQLAPDWIKRVLNALIPFLLLLGLIAAISWYIQRIEHKREIVEQNLKAMTAGYETASKAASQNAENVKILGDLRQVDADVMSKLVVINDNLAKSTAQTTAVRKELGARNVAVKAYLDQPVPSDLRSLLNRQVAKYSGGNETSSGVPAGKSSGGPN